MLNRFRTITAHVETYVLQVMLRKRHGFWAGLTRIYLFGAWKLFNFAVNIRRRLR
jgi:hypothetical protein